MRQRADGGAQPRVADHTGLARNRDKLQANQPLAMATTMARFWLRALRSWLREVVAGAVVDNMDAVTETAAALRRYLVAHPDACDTVTGIAAWWLARRDGGSPPEVAAATDDIRRLEQLLVGPGRPDGVPRGEARGAQWTP